MLLETKPNKVKASLLTAIKEDNLAEVKSIVEAYGITGNEELSKLNYFWNGLHCKMVVDLYLIIYSELFYRLLQLW